jgi:hypothetical protein
VELSEEAMEVWLNMFVYEALWLIMGEPTGEKLKFCWKGPAELMMGSSCIWNVSME